LAANVSISLAILLSQLILVKAGGGFEALGVFSLAYRWYLAIVFLSAALSPVALSILAHENRASGRGTSFGTVLRISFWVQTLVTLGPAILVVLVAPHLASLGGKGYMPATSVIIWLAVASVPTALNNVLSQAAISLDLIREWLVSDVVLGIGLVATTALLVLELGPVALAIGYVVGMLATCAVLARPVLKSLKRSDALGDQPTEANLST
jgi:O-antigen/teichoic acid export membrane protein